MAAINRWILSYQGRVVNIWYNGDYTVYGVNPNPGGQTPGDSNIVTLADLFGGHIGLQCGGGHNAWASVRDDYGYQVQFQAPNGTWITGEPQRDEHLQAIPTGDGYFALYSPAFGMYVTVDAGPDTAPNAGNCNPLRATTGDIKAAARFTATGLDRASVFDFLQVGQNASGLSFAGVSLANVNLGGSNNLSGCDFRRVAQGSLRGCVLNGAKLQYASFAGLHLDGLSISNADCTHADFSGCDFTSFTPGTPPPDLADAGLTGAVLPAGNSWSGANMPGAVLAEATLTGCDLSGAATNLSGANLSGTGVTLFEPVYQGGGGIGPDIWMDRVIAYDCDGTPGQPRTDYLVCYISGHGSAIVVRKKSDGTFGSVYFQGAGGDGIGGYNLADSRDQVIAFDYNSTGNLDHLVCYRPGAGLISILERHWTDQNTATFDKVWDSASGIGGSGGCNLGDDRDRIIAFDYEGTGHLDHLACYRPGTGMIWIFEKDTDQNNKVTFTPVFTSTSGIGGYDLRSSADQIIAYDCDGTPGQPKPNYLVCYRPGRGAIFIVRKKSDGTFDNVLLPVQGDLGNGIGGYDLLNPADRIIAYDYAGTGHLDHLVCYRPGTGTIWIIEKNTDPNNNVTFTPVYRRFGIGGYDLADPGDQVIAFDYAGTGHLDHLVCYRPGTGTIWIIQSRPARPATLQRCTLTGANLSAADLTGVDLTKAPSLTGANLTATQLPGAKLAGVNLTGVTLAGTNFTGTDMTQVTFSSPLNQPATDIDNPIIFAYCTLPYAVIGLNWSCLDLTKTTIEGLPTNSAGQVDLTGLVAVGLRRPRIDQDEDADFTGYVLDGANFANATLDGAVFTSAKLRQHTGTKASFAQASLISAQFTSATLDQANFTGATLGGIKSAQAASFSSAWISNCDFTGANAYGVIFAGATLVSANTLAGATSLQESDFSDAYLPYADFTGASLQGAKFDGACMVRCVLATANLTPAQQGAIPASLVSACLQGADFSGIQLGGANLDKAAITQDAGQIPVSHYDEYGNVIGPEPISWPASSFPGKASFSDTTTCPNDSTYGHNNQQGLSIPQMMQSKWAPTKWAPTGTVAPTAPTITGLSNGGGQVGVAFSGASAGPAPITSYTVRATDPNHPKSPPVTATGPSSPITVKGLTDGDSYVFTVTATSADGTSPPSDPSGTLNVGVAPVIVSGPAPGIVGKPYTSGFTVTGAPPPTVTFISGELPPGLTLGSDGGLTGTPTQAGSYTFTVQADNHVGLADDTVPVTISPASSG